MVPKCYVFIAVLAVVFFYLRVRLHNVGENGFGSATTAEVVSEGVDLSGKVAIVTGFNSGIGWDTARVLALRGATVVGVARSEKKAIEAIASIKQAHPDKSLNLIPMEMELDSFSSIRTFAKAFLAKDLPLHILILNAGVMAIENRETTAEGIEKQMGTNHVGHFLLSSLLLSKLEESAPSRVVALSSSANRMVDITFLDGEDLETKPYHPWTAYGNSKMANILFAQEFNKRYQSKGVTAVSVHPGGINTGLQKHMSYTDWRTLLFTVLGPLFKSTSQGAATSVYCATSPEIDTLNLGGRFFEDCHVSRPAMGIYSEDDKEGKNSLRLWEVTEKLISQHP